MATRQAEMQQDGAVVPGAPKMRHALQAIICAAGLLIALPAAAVFAPGIGILPPGLGGQNGLVASQIQVAGSVTADSPPPNNVGAPLLATDSYDLTSNDYSEDELTESRNTAAEINGYRGQAQSSATVKPGTIHAFTRVDIARPDIRGHVFADARALVSFTDVITVGENGGDFKMNLSLSYLFNTSPSPFTPRGSSARAQLWLFPFEPFVPLAPFTSGRNAQYYELKSVDSGDVNNQSIVLGSVDNLTPGSKFWIHTELELRSTAFWDNRFSNDLDASTRGDFSHTLNVFLDPASNNPSGTYTTASGLSYLSPAPVPLPATVWLLLPAIGGLGLLRRKAA